MEKWVGKVAVVTGASSGIGASILQQLLDHGMTVVGLARRVDNIKKTGERSQGNSEKLHAIKCDLTKEQEVIAAFAWIEENVGSVDVLVNSAGVAKEASLTEGRLDDWLTVFDVNVIGLCVCTREAIRIMRAAGTQGIIININSLAGERIPPVPGFGVYPASKRAITALSETLRHELADTKIRITNVSPGVVATDLMASYSIFSDKVFATMPVLKAEDVAAAVTYVLSAPLDVVVQDIVLRSLGETW